MRASFPSALGVLLLAAAVSSCGPPRGRGIPAGTPRAGVHVRDPYAGGSGAWYRGQVHMHSTIHKYFVHPDSLRDKVERYRDAGFDFVCVTDHNFVTAFPGSSYAVLPTRDPGVPGILFISGAEIGFTLTPAQEGVLPRKQHIGGVGMNWSVGRGDSLFHLAETDFATAQAAIDSIRTMRYAEGKEALAVINHPEMQARFDVRFYPMDLAPLKGQAGIEVYNTKWARSRPGGRAWQSHGASHWDYLLTRLGGMRWGFATDDAHAYVPGQDFLGGWILVQAPQLSTEAILDAVRAGRFVACVDSCAGAARDTASAVFTELGVRGRSVVAASDRPSEFTWWTDYGHLVRRREGVGADTFRVEGWESYVRVRVRNAAGAAYSQPFYVENPQRDPDRWQLRREGRTRLLYHFNEGAGPLAEDASGFGSPLLLAAPVIPPPERWRTLADTAAYRDSLWGAWVHNGVGTTPDETDLDRDRWGYAIRAHGTAYRGEVPVSDDSAFLVAEALSLEWIGAITRRTPSEQPLLVNESLGAQGRVRGWRLVVAEEGAPEAYRFLFRDARGRSHAVSFGRGLGTGETHLLAVCLREPVLPGRGVPGGGGSSGAVRAWAYVDGRLEAQPFGLGSTVAWRLAPVEPESRPLGVFQDPFDPQAEVFYRLRELRLSAGVRSRDEIREEAQRLGFLREDPARSPQGAPGRRSR